jgi:hypothetical protein
MEFEGSVLCSQVSQLSNPEPDESSSHPSIIIQHSEGSCYSPVMCKIQKLCPNLMMQFQMSEISFHLQAFALQVGAWSFPYYLKTI